MATVNIKRIMANTIATYIGTNVTGLSGLVKAVQEGPEGVTTFPSACLLPGTFVFNPSDAEEVYWADNPELDDPGVDDGILVLDVGEFNGIMTLELYGKSKPERELYEQRILDLFLSSEGSPGTLYIDSPTLTINGYISLYSVELKVRLVDEEWREEFSFEAKRYSFLDLEVGIPALTTRDAATIEILQLALNHDLDSDTPLEIVIVAEDGSTTPTS